MAPLLRYFSAVPGSIRGFINPRELHRSILTALGSGSLLGVLILILQSVLAHASSIFPDAGTASLAAIVLTLVLDLLRRQGQGQPATQASLMRAGIAPTTPDVATTTDREPLEIGTL